MPTYITRWDRTQNALVEVVGTGPDWIGSITGVPTLAVLGDTLQTPTEVAAANMSPHTVAGTPTVVLF